MIKLNLKQTKKKIQKQNLLRIQLKWFALFTEVKTKTKNTFYYFFYLLTKLFPMHITKTRRPKYFSTHRSNGQVRYSENNTIPNV